MQKLLRYSLRFTKVNSVTIINENANLTIVQGKYYTQFKIK